MGVSFAVAFAVAYPESTLGMILAQPAGGPRWRMNAQRMFSQHAAFAEERGLKAVVQLARERRTTFQAEPLVGPWGWTIARDDEFADRFLERDPSAYVALVRAIGPAMFDRDTVPGADAEELMALHVPALIIPDDTTHHAPSGAHYLRECLPAAVYHNVHPTEQTPEMVRDWLLKFLDSTVEAAAKDESARPG